MTVVRIRIAILDSIECVMVSPVVLEVVASGLVEGIVAVLG